MNLTSEQNDILQEMINIGIGQAASVINAMLDSHVVLRVPVVELLSPEELSTRSQSLLTPKKVSAVRLGFKGPFAGDASLVFTTEAAVKFITLLTEEEPNSPDLDSIMVGTLTEVGNIVLNGVMGAIGNEIKEHIFYSVPSYVEKPYEVLQQPGAANHPNTKVVWVHTSFSIEEHSIEGDILLIFEVGSIDLLLAAINRALNNQN